jgi:hypothetical protein
MVKDHARERLLECRFLQRAGRAGA